MIESAKTHYALLRNIYEIAAPFGKSKLLLIIGLSVAQGASQALGVTSILPFLSVASAPEKFLNSALGIWITSTFPNLKDTELLMAAGILSIAVLAATNLLNMIAEFARNRYVCSFSHWLRSDLLTRASHQPYRNFLNINTSVIGKKIVNDVTQFSLEVLLPLLDSLARVVTILFLLFTLMLINPALTAIACSVVSVYYILIYSTFGKWRRSTAENLKTSHRNIFKTVQELFTGIKAVKVHNVESFFISQFKENSLKHSTLMSWLPVIQNGPRYILEPLAFGGIVAYAILLIHQGISPADSIPALAVMALAAYKLLPAFQMLYAQMTQITTMRHTLDEVYSEIHGNETTSRKQFSQNEGSKSQQPRFHWNECFELKKVSFRYPNASQETLQDISFRLEKNESLGISGKTGAGKSTLVDLILGLHEPTSGSLIVDGEALTQDQIMRWQSSIGYVPQDIFLIDDSITANIAFGIPTPLIDHSAVVHACDKAQLTEFIEKSLPDGLNTQIGERGIRLSGGQRQRIGLARALYNNPDLIILDEATSALDADTEAAVMRSIKALGGKVTMIIIAHRLNTLENCNRILSLEEGKILVQKPFETRINVKGL